MIANTTTGTAVVAVFLLHAAGQPGLCPQYPVATKRVVRAVLKSADYCIAEPTRVAHSWSMRGFTTADYALQTLMTSFDSGANTTPRIRFGSTRCGCRRPA